MNITNFENCSIEQLKQLGKEFFKFIETATSEDEVEQIFKCFTLAYLNADLKDRREEVEAQVLMDLVGKRKIEYDLGPIATRAKEAFSNIKTILGMEK